MNGREMHSALAGTFGMGDVAAKSIHEVSRAVRDVMVAGTVAGQPAPAATHQHQAKARAGIQLNADMLGGPKFNG
jgi:hypothetical protein